MFSQLQRIAFIALGLRIWVWSHGGLLLADENGRTRRETYAGATLSNTNPTRTEPGQIPGLSDERPLTHKLISSINTRSSNAMYSGSASWSIFLCGILTAINWMRERLTPTCHVTCSNLTDGNWLQLQLATGSTPQLGERTSLRPDYIQLLSLLYQTSQTVFILQSVAYYTTSNIYITIYHTYLKIFYNIGHT
jgi:hypothetical protein